MLGEATIQAVHCRRSGDTLCSSVFHRAAFHPLLAAPGRTQKADSIPIRDRSIGRAIEFDISEPPRRSPLSARSSGRLLPT